VCAQLEGKVPADPVDLRISVMKLEGKVPADPVDLRISVMKPLGAKWLVDLYDYLKDKPEIIKNGFKEAGLLECVP